MTVALHDGYNPQNTRHQNPGKLIQLSHNAGLVQGCSNSIANALELLQSYAKPSICGLDLQDERGWDRCYLHICLSLIILYCFIRTSNAGAITVPAILELLLELHFPWKNPRTFPQYTEGSPQRTFGTTFQRCWSSQWSITDNSIHPCFYHCPSQ